MELAITKYLKEHGLEKTLADFKLKHKEYPHKILIKYDSIESNFTNDEVRDSRGLVVEKGTWKVMSLAFRKFFNLGEGHAAPVEWTTSRVFKKLDGSMIHVYFDYITKDVCFGTTGTAEGEGDVDNFHCMKMGGTFSDLFVHAFADTLARNSSISFGEGIDPIVRRNLVKAFFIKYAGYTLAFELCTPFNVVVTPHTENTIYLIGARRLDTLQEVAYEELEKIANDLHISLAPTVSLNGTPEELRETFEGMSYKEEGYVVCDYGKHGKYGFERLKMKNPAYCAIHFFKDSTAFWRIVDIVRSGDDNVNEYKATFPGREDEIDHIQNAFHDITNGLNDFVAVVDTFDEYVQYRKHKDSITFESKGLDADILKKLKDNGLSHVMELGRFTNVELLKFLDKREIDIVRKLSSNRGDDVGLDLRKRGVMKIMAWVAEKSLKKHLGFFLSYLDATENVKKYLMKQDGKELYNELIKGFKPVLTHGSEK